MKNKELLSPDAPDTAAGGAPEAEPMTLDEIRKAERMSLWRLDRRIRTDRDFGILKEVVEELDILQTEKLKCAEKAATPTEKEALREQVALWDEAYLGETSSLSAHWPANDEDMKPSAGKVTACNVAVTRIRHILTGKMLPELEAEAAHKSSYTKINRDGSKSSLKGTAVAANIAQAVAAFEYSKDKLSPLNHVVNVRRFLNQLPNSGAEAEQLKKDIVQYLSADGVVPSDLAHVEGGYVRWPYRFHLVLDERMLLAELKNVPKIGLQIKAADEQKKTPEVRASREELEKIVAGAFTRLRAERESKNSISVETMREVFLTIPLHKPFSDACARAFKAAELWTGKRYSRKAETGEKPVMNEFETTIKEADERKRTMAAETTPPAIEPAPVIEATDWKGTVENFNKALAPLFTLFEQSLADGKKDEVSEVLNKLRELASVAKAEAKAYQDGPLIENFTDMEEFANTILAAFALGPNGIQPEWKEKTLTVARGRLIPQVPTVEGDRVSRGAVPEVSIEVRDELKRGDSDLIALRGEFEEAAKNGKTNLALEDLGSFIEICGEQRNLAQSVNHPDLGRYESRVQQVQWLNERLKEAQAETDTIPLDRVLQFLDHIIGKRTFGIVRTPTTMEEYFKGATDSRENFLVRLGNMETDQMFENIPKEKRALAVSKAMEFFEEAFTRWDSPEFQSQSVEARREAIMDDLVEGVNPGFHSVTMKLCEREFLLPTQGVVKAPQSLAVVRHRLSAVARRAPRVEVRPEDIQDVVPAGTGTAETTSKELSPGQKKAQIIAAMGAMKRPALPPIPQTPAAIHEALKARALVLQRQREEEAARVALEKGVKEQKALPPTPPKTALEMHEALKAKLLAFEEKRKDEAAARKAKESGE